jgi:putative redox protein
VTTHRIVTQWQQKMAFDAEVDGFHLLLDAAPEHGGADQGPRPKPLLLVALAGCTGMDVVAILSKMREPLQHFRVLVEGDLSEGHPAFYEKVRIVYEFRTADGLDPAKVERAVHLSQDRYCGVSAMLKKASELSFEIRYV